MPNPIVEVWGHPGPEESEATMGTYSAVKPTEAEIAAYVARKGHKPVVGMVQCGPCGARIWNTGLGRGAHDRGQACKTRAAQIEAMRERLVEAATTPAIPFNPAGAAQTVAAVGAAASIASGTAAAELVEVATDRGRKLVSRAELAAEASARVAEPAGVRRSAKLPGLTAAQAASLQLVAAGHVSYAPGRSRSTRYSYSAYIGGKFVRRTKSVDALYEAGLVELTGSASSACVVVLTERGAALLGVDHTPVAANLLKRGVRIITADGAVARIVEMVLVDGGHFYELRLSVNNASFAHETYGYFAPVKVAPVPVIDEN